MSSGYQPPSQQNPSTTYSLVASQQQQQSSPLAKAVSSAATTPGTTAAATSLPILSQLDVLMKTLSDASQRDDLKLKALQDISNNFEALATTSAYAPLIDNLIRAFLKLFNETVPQFIGENNTQQLRKLMLEMTNRMPCNDYLKQYAKPIQQQMFKIVQTENEENVMIALKIITEHQKQFRPQFSVEVQQFIAFCKTLYRDLAQALPGIFEPRRSIRVNEIQELHIEQALSQAFCVCPIQTDQKHADGSQVVYTLLPRGVQSLKVLAELPVVVVLLYQIHRANVQSEIAEFIPLILQMVNLGPSREQRNHPNFNRELFIEFLCAQVKALSFLAFLTRLFQETVQNHSTSLVQGILQLLEHCPPEVTHQRRELLMATRHLLSSDLRVKFIPHLPKLFSENLMIGSGWTAQDTLRPLVFSMLADLVHHVRAQLSYSAICSSVHLFSRCIHDPTLPAYVQAMCCKLLLNLVECIVNVERHQDESIRELLFYMLDVFIRKFKVVAKQMNAIVDRNTNDNSGINDETNGNGGSGASRLTTVDKESESMSSPDVEKKDDDVQPPVATDQMAVDDSSTTTSVIDDSTSTVRSSSQIVSIYWGVIATPISVHDCRSLVKVLVGGAKTTIWGIGNARMSPEGCRISPEKETQLFVRLLRYGIQCLDIYAFVQTPTIGGGSMTTTYQRSPPTKEEKEALDHFASVFTMLNPLTFKEIFTNNIEFLIDRIANNYALQLVCNSFLVNPQTSAKFGSILVEYLLERLPEMGVSNDRSALYLKLFKLVFSSVSCSQSTGCVENEQMLKPHLHRMVHRAMELALRGKEPINYFLLLRALFRSIGGGSHDLLYQEFLPLLPSLLQQLNRLQSGSHKQQMRELFVELCLTVPVRLSSLLPYLPLLMDPLVCALNGSPTLVQQGLRTLELCVDNLQPEYLYEHMAPVRAALMHGLWRTVGAATDEAASSIAFRILGKFGGSNRKMLADPQMLEYLNDEQMNGPSLTLNYCDPSSDDVTSSTIIVADAVRTALEHLRSDPLDTPTRRHAWLFVKSMLYASFKLSDRTVIDRLEQQMLAKIDVINGRLETSDINRCGIYRCTDESSRSVFLDALTAVFFAVVAKDLRAQVLSFFNAIIRQLTLQAILENADTEYRLELNDNQCMDAAVLVDAVVNALADTSKDFCHSAIVALRFIKDTATTLFGTIDKACKLPLFQYLLDSIVDLCYRPAWYARLGGCTGLQYLLEHFPKSMATDNIVAILSAYFEVIIGLADEVSSGAIDMAVQGIELLLNTCFRDYSTTNSEDMIKIVLIQIARHLQSPNRALRSQCISILEQLRTLSGLSINYILSLIKDELSELINVGENNFTTMSIWSQIGFMDAFSYLHSLDPLLFTFDLDNSIEKSYADELMKLCRTDDAILDKMANYKQSLNMPTSTPGSHLIALKSAAIRATVSCYISAIQPVLIEMDIVVSSKAVDVEDDEMKTLTERQQLFLTALKCLTHGHCKLQEEAFSALSMAMNRVPMERSVLHAEMRPVLLNLSDYKTLSLNVVKRLLYLTRLSPNTFNEKFCDQILVHLKKWVDSALVQQLTTKTTDEIKACEIVLEILHETPAASARFIDVVIPMITKAESQLTLEPGINWRRPLLRYLIRYPNETINFLVNEDNIRVESCRNLFLWLVKQPEGVALRQMLIADSSCIENLLRGCTLSNGQSSPSEVPLTVLEVLALRLVSAIGKRNVEWVPKSGQMIDKIRQLWNDERFKCRYKGETVDSSKFEAPKLAIKCMLRYYRSDPNNVELLFDMCQCFVGNLSTDFTSLLSFIEFEVVPNYTIEWRRLAFRRAVDMFIGEQNVGTIRLFIKILQYIILPCLAYSLERSDADKLIGSAPAPDDHDDDNLVSLFVSRVIDNQKSKGQLPDGLHIMLYQLSCLFVAHAPQHIHDSSSKKQGSRLRTFMLFAWPCLQLNSQQDPTTKYTGHLLIAHIIDKFAINRKIVLQVFHSLLKAHQQDPRGVIRQALDILTPAVPLRMEDGYHQLMSFAKKIIIEEGHTPAQLFHLLQVIVRHYKVYYYVRHQLTQYLMNGIQKLVTSQGTVENRKLAVDVCEMIIKWELCRLRFNQLSNDSPTLSFMSDPDVMQLLKSTSSIDGRSFFDEKRTTTPASASVSSTQSLPDNGNPIEKVYVDQVVNILVRMAAQVPEALTGSTGTQTVASVEALNKRSLQLLKIALKVDIWGDTATVKLSWMEKALSSADPQTYRDQPQQNFVQTYICLDVLTYLVGVLPSQHVIAAVKQCQRGIVCCLNCANSQVNSDIRYVLRYLQVVRSLYGLITRLLSVTKSSPTGLDECDILNQLLAKFIIDSLSNYEKMIGSNVASLYGTMTLLRAMCTAHASYLDRTCLSPFIKTLQKLVKDHTAPMQTDPVKSAADIITLCLELLRPRFDTLSTEIRKQITQNIFMPLIDKSPSSRVIGMIVKIVDEWIRSMDKPISILSLLVKLMINLEKRFINEKDLYKSFLNTILYVYETSSLRSNDLAVKLEPAFNAGLCHPDNELRCKFFTVFNRSISNNPYDRLYHIICMHNWEPMQRYFWIKQCVNLILSAVESSTNVILSNGATFARLFESITIGDPMEVDQTSSSVIHVLLEKQKRFLIDAYDAKLETTLASLIELAYANDRLAHRLWILLLPSIWSAFSDKQRDTISHEIMPFLASGNEYYLGMIVSFIGNHPAQKDAPVSVLDTFLQAFARCTPTISIKPNLLKVYGIVGFTYVACSHRLWHCAILLLETPAYTVAKFQNMHDVFAQDRPPIAIADKLELLDSLSDLYKLLAETDMFVAVWSRRCYYEDTNRALAFAQHGLCTHAVRVLESAMDTMQKRLALPMSVVDSSATTTTVGGGGNNSITLPLIAEMNLWEEEWIRSTKELNQWDTLKDFANSNAVQDPGLLMECAWRMPNWSLMKEALIQIESCTPPEYYWKAHLYRAMLLVCQPDDRATTTVDRCVEAANQQLIADWRKLPTLVSHSHLPILQAAHLIQEVAEAGQASHSLSCAGTTPQSTIINEVKSIIKTWRNRAPTLSDPLMHWYDVYDWRLHHYMSMLAVFESWEQTNQQQALLPIHSCAQSMIQLAKISRQHGHIETALDCLNKLHSMPNLPTMDGHAKLYQHLKCLIRVADVGSRETDRNDALFEGLDIIENTNISYFNKDQTARIFAVKGALLSRLEKSEEANKAFSASLQMHESLTQACSAWSLWGEHLEGLFFNDRTEKSAQTIALNAVVSYLEAARKEHETKARKHFARLFWLMKALLPCSDVVDHKLNDILLKYGLQLPPLPQLITHLQYRPSQAIARIISHIGHAYPQQTYYALRNVLPTEQLSQRINSNEYLPVPPVDDVDDEMMDDDNGVGYEDRLWHIVDELRTRRPTDIRCLERICYELEHLGETWIERQLRHLRSLLDTLYRTAFESRNEIFAALQINRQTEQQLVDYITDILPPMPIELVGDDESMRQFIIASETQIRTDLQPGNTRIAALITKLAKWIGILDAKVGNLSKSILLKEQSLYLALFTSQMGNVEVFSEVLTPKTGQYSVLISRFMPRYYVLQTAATTARRICVRAQSGKLYTYVIRKTVDEPTDSRVLQLFKMINQLLSKERETCRRLLQYALPRQVTIGRRCQLLEADASTTTFYDILAAVCRRQQRTPIDLVNYYYERMVAARSRPSQKLLADVLRDISSTSIVPANALRLWMNERFVDATHYFTMRKQIALHAALLNIAEFVLHLTWLNIDQMNVNLSTGQLFSCGFAFDINENNKELDANRPVPFRLSLCLQHYLNWSIDGHMTGAMIATARCLQQRNVTNLLRPLLWDVYHTRRRTDGESLVTPADANELIVRVNRAVAAVSTRLQNVANFEGGKSPIQTLVMAARQIDNLCRMDPTWHPWF